MDNVMSLKCYVIRAAHWSFCVFICSRTCAIELQDTVVVTGQWDGGLSDYRGVQVYNISGPQEQLPSLLTTRYSHACAHFVDSENRVVSRYT